MSKQHDNKLDNDALQSGAGDDAARGQDEREFGAGGQVVQSTGAEEQRDVNRDGKLGSAGMTPANPD